LVTDPGSVDTRAAPMALAYSVIAAERVGEDEPPDKA